MATLLDPHHAGHRNPFRFLFTDEPLFNVYHALRYYLLGGAAFPHHLLQGVLVAANAVLAFSLVWRLSRDYRLSFVFLFFFLTRPNHGEAYYWLAAVYVLMLFWLLLAAHLALSWLRGGRAWLLAGGWVFYSLAIFTHEAAFGFLGVFAALWALERRGGLLRFALPLAATNAAYLAVRQTRWFGIGEAGFLYSRPLQPGRVGENFLVSLRVNFGGRFVEIARELVRELPDRSALILPLLGIAAVLLFVSLRSERRPLRALPLAAFAVAWFVFAYAPTYVLFIGSRHNYLPSLGVCLLLALALAAWRGPKLVEGALLVAAAGLATGFYAASLAEGHRWLEATQFVARLQSQMMSARPHLAPDTRVILLDIPHVWKGVPLLPPYAVDTALRLWYGHPQILTHPDFIPRKHDFLFHEGSPEHPQSYDYLLLFTYKDQALVERKYLVFEDGTRVRLGAKLDGGSEGPALNVVAGRRYPAIPSNNTLDR